MFGSCTGGARHVAKMDHTHLPRERNAIVYLYICMSSLAGWRGTVILFGDGPTQHPEPTLLQDTPRPTDTWAPVRPQHSNPTAGENRSHYHSTTIRAAAPQRTEEKRNHHPSPSSTPPTPPTDRCWASTWVAFFNLPLNLASFPSLPLPLDR